MSVDSWAGYESIHSETPLTEGNTVRIGGEAAWVARPAEDLPPKLIKSRYCLIAPLGRGGFGEVWHAHDNVLDRDVAMKRPRRDREHSDDVVNEFIQEAQQVCRLQSPGFVPVYDVIEGDDIWIVMELLDGGSVTQLVHQAPVDPAVAARLIADVAENLHSAHKQGFVHRDLKPGNILLDRHGHPFISDLGLSTDERRQLAEPSGVVGTPSYMAPEQAAGKSHFVDARADVYSLGVIFYQLLTGRLPFLAENREAFLAQLTERDGPRPLRTINEEIPAELEAICLKCLRRQTSDRYTTALDLAQHLRQWLAPPVKIRRTAIYALVIATVALVAAAGGGAYWVTMSAASALPDRMDHDGERTAATAERGEIFVASDKGEPPTWRYDALENSYQLTSRQICLLGLGENRTPFKEISVTFDPWNSNSHYGIFIGGRYREWSGKPYPICQYFQIMRYDTKTYFVERLDATYLEINDSLVPEHSVRWRISVDAVKDHTLRLSLDEHGVKSLTFGGQECPAELLQRGNRNYAREDYLGTWGIYNYEGTTKFRHVKFQ